MTPPFSRRASITLVASFVLLALSMGAAIGAARIATRPGDRLVVLGSGDAISILVATDSTGIMLATGSNVADFGNAYARTAFVPRRAPDVLLRAGSGRDRTVAEEAASMFGDALIFDLGNAWTSGDEVSVPLPTDPARFSLNNRLTVIVETIPPPDNASGPADWRMTVTRSGSRIAIVSTQEAVEQFDWPDPASMIIVASGTVNDLDRLIEPTRAGTVVVPAPALSADLVAERTSVETQSMLSVVSVRPGGLATVSFETGRVRLSTDEEIYAFTDA